MAQLIKVLATKPDYLISDPGTHIVGETDSNNMLSDLHIHAMAHIYTHLHVVIMNIHTYIHTHVYTYINTIKSFCKNRKMFHWILDNHTDIVNFLFLLLQIIYWITFIKLSTKALNTVLALRFTCFCLLYILLQGNYHHPNNSCYWLYT